MDSSHITEEHRILREQVDRFVDEEIIPMPTSGKWMAWCPAKP